MTGVAESSSRVPCHRTLVAPTTRTRPTLTTTAAASADTLWLTFPPMMLLFLDKPFGLTLVYGVLGSAFMPFLAITLMLLLNSKRIERDGRSGWLSNTLLGASSALFLVLLVSDLVERFG